LLQLRVVGLCGTDLFKLDNGLAAPGSVLGHELVGQVVAAGTGVERFKLGDRVAVPHHVPCGQCSLCRRGNETMCVQFRENLMEPGGFAERILIRKSAVEQAAHLVPMHVPDAAAVFMEPAACVLRGIERSGVHDGGVGAVLGAGSMGLLHLLVLKAAHPALRVVVVDPVEERRALASKLGAAFAVGPGEPARAAVEEASAGLGADAIFDTVGGSVPLRAALKLSRQGGSVVLFAHAGEGEAAAFDLNDLFKFERRVLGTYSGGLKEQRRIFQWLCSGALDPSRLATHQLPLDEFQRGVALTRSRQALKVLYGPRGKPSS